MKKITECQVKKQLEVRSGRPNLLTFPRNVTRRVRFINDQALPVVIHWQRKKDGTKFPIQCPDFDPATEEFTKRDCIACHAKRLPAEKRYLMHVIDLSDNSVKILSAPPQLMEKIVVAIKKYKIHHPKNGRALLITRIDTEVPTFDVKIDKVITAVNPPAKLPDLSTVYTMGFKFTQDGTTKSAAPTSKSESEDTSEETVEMEFGSDELTLDESDIKAEPLEDSDTSDEDLDIE